MFEMYTRCILKHETRDTVCITLLIIITDLQIHGFTTGGLLERAMNHAVH